VPQATRMLRRMRNVFRAVLLISMLAILALSVVPPALRPVTGIPHVVEHSVIFAIAGTALALSFTRGWPTLGIVLLVFAAFVEVIQLPIPGRHARVSDFAVDTLGAWLGLVLGLGLCALARRLSRTPP
jgi:FtsH-binding integral membrane protein